jgi:hypothetical protein
MDKKKILFISGIVVASLIAFLLLILLYNYLNSRASIFEKPKPAVNQANNHNELNQYPDEDLPPVVRQPINQTLREFGQNELEKMASSFAERFGSFSNHSSFNNIVDLKVFMTDNMKDWADKFILEKQSSQDFKAAYYGITTIATSEKTLEFDPDKGRAKVLVSTYRRESIGDDSNSSSYEQNIEISFEKKGGVWKIDSAYWQDK